MAFRDFGGHKNTLSTYIFYECLYYIIYHHSTRLLT